MVKNNPKLGVKPGLPDDWISQEDYDELLATITLIAKGKPLRAVVQALAEALGVRSDAKKLRSMVIHTMVIHEAMRDHDRYNAVTRVLDHVVHREQQEQRAKGVADVARAKLTYGQKHTRMRDNFELRRMQAETQKMKDREHALLNQLLFGDTPGSKS